MVIDLKPFFSTNPKMTKEFPVQGLLPKVRPEADGVPSVLDRSYPTTT